VVAQCSQCGRPAPAEPAALSGWRQGELALEEELDEVTAGLLVCPDCDAEDREGEYEAGGGA